MKTKIKFLATMLMGIVLSVNVWGADPETIYYENFGSVTDNADFSAGTAFSDSKTWEMLSTTWRLGKNSTYPSSGYTGASGNSAAWVQTASKTFTLVFGDLTDYTNVILSFGYYNNASASGNRTFETHVSSDGGSTWTEIDCHKTRTNNTEWDGVTYSVPDAKLANFAIRFTSTAGNNSRVDDIKLVGTPATPKSKHNVNWYVNGSVWKTTQVAEGATIELPTNPGAPEGCEGKSFFGWTESSSYEDATTVPTIIGDDEEMGTTEVNYYAVFATKELNSSATTAVKIDKSEITNGMTILLVDGQDDAIGNEEVEVEGWTYLAPTHLTITNSIVTSMSNDAKWTVTIDGDHYKFEQNSDFMYMGYAGDLYLGDWDDKWALAKYKVGYSIQNYDIEYYIYGYENGYIGEEEKIFAFLLYTPGTWSDFTTTCVTCSNEVNVNKGSMTGGGITISADKVCADGDGGSVTVTPNPNEHYSCTGVTATVGNVTGPEAGVYTVSGITAETTISATFVEDAKATVTWSVNGVTKKSSQVYVGETASAPADPEDMPICADAFVGWSVSTLVGEEHDAPLDLFSTTSPTITADVTFNAVFATAEGGGTVTHTMDVPQGAALSGYEDRNFPDDQGYTWSGKFSGFDNVGEKFWSFKKHQDNYHISSPTFAGNVSSIKFWVRQTASGTRSIILRRNTSNAQPTESDMGLTAAVSQNDEVQEVTITPTTQEFTQFNIYVSDGMGFRKIQVVTGGGVTYSNYVTSCATYTVTFKSNGADVTIVSNVAPGQQVTAPTLAEIQTEAGKRNACTNYLVGWSTDSHYTDPSDAPTGMLKPNAEGKITIPSDITSDVTYYAVYADAVEQ